ncbi:J domain-containing protein [Agromyces sp. SYSU T0242]|uniref:J domain-containing protein n=1 Tax=Agromyces litoreus TaxID=3158561 RepID=UPI00339AC847
MAGAEMTRDEAARVLGVQPDAAASEVDRAYRRLARDLHPDRFVGSSPDEVRAASARFVEVTRAYRLLAESPAGARRRATGPVVVERPPASGPATPAVVVRPFSPWLFGTWTAVLLLGVVLSTATGPLIAPVDLWGRLALLVAAAVATGLTRRRWAWWATLALLGLSGAAVIASTTVAGLLGLGIMAVGCVGLAVQAGLVRFPDQ